jgi:hypothetical protein
VWQGSRYRHDGFGLAELTASIQAGDSLGGSLSFLILPSAIEEKNWLEDGDAQYYGAKTVKSNGIHRACSLCTGKPSAKSSRTLTLFAHKPSLPVSWFPFLTVLAPTQCPQTIPWAYPDSIMSENQDASPETLAKNTLLHILPSPPASPPSLVRVIFGASFPETCFHHPCNRVTCIQATDSPGP